MNEKGIAVGQQYEFVIKKCSKVKGAALFDTDKGLYMLREFRGSEKHLEKEEELLKKISEEGWMYTDYPVRNKEGKLVSTAADGQQYLLKRWYEARECEVYNRGLVEQGIKALAVFHTKACYKNLPEMFVNEKNPQDDSLELMKRRTEELRKCQKYVQNKKRKNEFEWMLAKCIPAFYEQAISVTDKVMELREEEKEKDIYNSKAGERRFGVIHGDYNYHNIAFADVERKPFIMNFGHCGYGIQMTDLYNYLRKVMEKHNWNEELGHRLIGAYCKIRPVDAWEYTYLQKNMAYPKKFWKIVNYYMNHGKCFIPDKDVQKLKNVIEQEYVKTNFLSTM